MTFFRVLPVFFLIFSIESHAFAAEGDVAAPAPDSAVPVTSVSASLQLPQAAIAIGQSLPPSTNDQLSLKSDLASPARLQNNEDMGSIVVRTGEDANSVISNGEALVDEDGEIIPVDPQTLEETKILTDTQDVPPEDEGVTIPINEVTYDFPVVENQKVTFYIDYFTSEKGRTVFSRWLERTTRYLPYMREVFAAQGLPQDLVYLSIVESGLNPNAYSWAHASGPWQFIPGTGKLFGLDSDYWCDERRNFEKSTLAAARYLKDLYAFFDGDWYLAVASYNAGPGTLTNAIKRTGSRDFWELARSRYLKEETKNYIPKLLAVLIIAKQPHKYGFTDLAYLEPLTVDRVLIPGQTDLQLIARLTDSTYDQIKELNPELKRWSTPPKEESYEIKVPLGTKDIFEAAYFELPVDERSSYEYYRVAKGDSLKSIAKKFGVKGDSILAFNSIANPKAIRAGKGLVIPKRDGVPPIPLEDLREDPVIVKMVGSKIYIVKKGDTLGKISRRTGVPEKNLRAWNRLGGKGILRIGQKLVLGPSKGKSSSSTVALATKKGDKTDKPSSKKSGSGGRTDKIVHKVRKGDSLDKIARLYDVSTSDLRDWNSLPKRHVLQPGDQLTIRTQSRRGG